METKAILSANQARILPGQKQNIWIFGFGGENRIGLKRNNDHLSMRGYGELFFTFFTILSSLICKSDLRVKSSRD